MEHRFYGIYRGVCIDNADPDNLNRIRLKVPQVLHTNITNWAYPCLPVTDNANHLDHLPHLAADVAALLTTHTSHNISVSGTTSAASAGTAHTHTFSATQTLAHAAHAGTSGTLTHAHTTSTDLLDKDGSELGNPAAEHTYHRQVPNISQGVWVMFEGGDPNFPVWMGVY
jgi:Type VI secretion system/phage-baseplate injector OB domain